MTITDLHTYVPAQRPAKTTATRESRLIHELEERIVELNARIVDCETAIKNHPDWADVGETTLAEYKAAQNTLKATRDEVVALTATTALAA